VFAFSGLIRRQTSTQHTHQGSPSLHAPHASLPSPAYNRPAPYANSRPGDAGRAQVGPGGIRDHRPPIIGGRSLGAWTVGVTPNGPAMHGTWRPSDATRVDVGLGLDWDGSPRVGVGLRARF
jgi:hypothetical protein